MRTYKLSLWIGVGALLCFSFPSFTQANILNVPNDLCVTSQPNGNNRIVYNVTSLKSNCIEMIASNPGNAAKKLTMGQANNRMAPSANATVVTFPKLFSITKAQDGKNVFNFGNDCGEGGVDDANVTVSYQGDAAGTGNASGGNTPVRLDIGADEIFTVANNNVNPTSNVPENFLRVIANGNNTATISIPSETRQGQVIVAIFADRGSPNPIALLDPDPKTSAMTTITVDRDVLVVPIIRPKRNGNTLVYEVGDPQENGTIIVEEDE